MSTEQKPKVLIRLKCFKKLPLMSKSIKCMKVSLDIRKVYS